MALIFPETTKYLIDFFESRKLQYESAEKDFNCEYDEMYPYQFIKKEDRPEIYMSIYDLRYNFGNTKSLLDLRVPESFSTPQKVIEAIIAYKEYLIKDNKLLADLRKKYAKSEIKILPFDIVIELTEEVIDVLNHVLTFNELQDYIPKKVELYNIYIKRGDTIQIKHALNNDDIQLILDAINKGENEVFIDGKTIDIGTFETIKIFDTSKAFNKTDKGGLKNELDQYSKTLNKKGIELLKQTGNEVTDKFNIKKPLINNQKNKIININNLDSLSDKTGKIFISHSSKNSVIVTKFCDLILNNGLHINTSTDVFNTSLPGSKPLTGEDFRLRIKNELLNAKLVLQFISKEYKSSEVCLNEMGAAWVLSDNVIPLIIEKDEYEVGFLHITNQQCRLSNESDILKLIDELKTKGIIQDYNLSRLTSKVKEFTDWLNHNQFNLEKKSEINAQPIEVIPDLCIVKLKNKKGLYLNNTSIYHPIPDDNITPQLLGYSKIKPIELSIEEFEPEKIGQNIDSVIGAKLYNVAHTNNHWLILNNKRHFIPDQETLKQLLERCSCKDMGMVDYAFLQEHFKQSIDLNSITSF